MADLDDSSGPEDGNFEIPAWDAVFITSQKAARSRGERDATIEDLRRSLPDQEILASFGIDLGQIEG